MLARCLIPQWEAWAYIPIDFEEQRSHQVLTTYSTKASIPSNRNFSNRSFSKSFDMQMFHLFLWKDDMVNCVLEIPPCAVMAGWNAGAAQWNACHRPCSASCLPALCGSAAVEKGEGEEKKEQASSTSKGAIIEAGNWWFASRFRGGNCFLHLDMFQMVKSVSSRAVAVLRNAF